ncbi:thioredoxin reductase (NADPH) [Psychroflexus salarius]|uniref:Thioredoxin reductase (NADPH) n=1 Tax=Psychroflexus salarius TaxID=1155689 RepID=A0A1M4W3J9_9FLAO|nr:YpdA family putative bacillithiol disulfide reductase [Psychroflexus salarius]SHE75874.1 thioredoxin reductase (NADPH) [Psychroflexus salarius]
MTYDVLIIGGGPIGIACALEAKKKNLSYIIIEKGALVNSLYHYPETMTFFSTSEKLELDHIPFISKNPKPTKQEALEYYRRVATSNQINIRLFEEVESVKHHDQFIEVNTNKTSYATHNIVVATGFYDIPNKLGVKGEDLDKVKHYYKDPHYYAMQNVVVVGASNSAVDAALETYRKGAHVSMIIRGSEIGQRVKYWVRPDIINRIEEGSIKAYFNSEITEITQSEVVFRNNKGKETSITNDFVLALTGYKPNFKFLEKLGVKVEAENNYIPIYDPQTMKTNVDNIYLAGVICGGMETHKWFIENSRVHAAMIMEHIKN